MRPIWRGWLSPPFLIALSLLGVTALLGGPVAERLNLVRHKRPLPLVRPLTEFRRSALEPYKVIKVDVLRPEEIEALGTSEVISWHLQGNAEGSRPPRLAHLLVTYYTGGASLVPHTPDLCFVAQGYQPTCPHENATVNVSSLSDGLSEIPVRVLTFGKTGIYGGAEQSVVYTFFVNDRFSASRNMVRALTSGVRNHYAYFSKVEVSFAGASREETVRLAEELFAKVLPELRARHWPDFAAAERRIRDQGSGIGDQPEDP